MSVNVCKHILPLTKTQESYTIIATETKIFASCPGAHQLAFTQRSHPAPQPQIQ